MLNKKKNRASDKPIVLTYFYQDPIKIQKNGYLRKAINLVKIVEYNQFNSWKEISF